jgi:hypothetical protein
MLTRNTWKPKLKQHLTVAPKKMKYVGESNTASTGFVCGRLKIADEHDQRSK